MTSLHVVSIDHDAKMLRSTNYATGAVENETELATDPTTLAISHTTEYVAIGTEANTVIYHAGSLELIKALEVGRTEATAFSLDGKYLATGGEDGIVRLFTFPACAPVKDGKEHTTYVYALGFSPSSKQLVSASLDKSLCIWSVPSMGKVRTLKGHTEAVLSALFLSESAIVSGSSDKSIRVWNAVNGDCIKEIKLAGSVVSLAHSPDRSAFASGSDDGTVNIYSTKSYDTTKSVTYESLVQRVYFPDNASIIIGLEDSAMIIVDAASGKTTRTLSHVEILTGLALFPPPGPIGFFFTMFTLI